MPASPFVFSRGHLCKDNIATAKTGMIWVEETTPNKPFQQERPKE